MLESNLRLVKGAKTDKKMVEIMGVKTTEESEVVSMAISALEKEKEQALQETKTSSSKNNFINNDNIKSQICQEGVKTVLN